MFILVLIVGVQLMFTHIMIDVDKLISLFGNIMIWLFFFLLVMMVLKGNWYLFEIIYSYNTIKSPALAKNAISVGAVYSDYDFADGVNYVTYFSSRAHPDRKRIKPDVVAVGVLLSAASLSAEDCGSDCKDHASITLKGGTYPFQ